nr:hypothetical protein [uncultured Caproiciproducens sp.]
MSFYRSRLMDRHAGCYLNFRCLSEAFAIILFALSCLQVFLNYGSLPEQIPDVFRFGGNAEVPKVYLIYLLVLQIGVYVVLSLFQYHPEWRMYSTKLLPALRDAKTRETIYRFSSMSMLAAKTEAVFTIAVVIMGVVLNLNVAIATGAMMAIMLFTFAVFRIKLFRPGF